MIFMEQEGEKVADLKKSGSCIQGLEERWDARASRSARAGGGGGEIGGFEGWAYEGQLE